MLPLGLGARGLAEAIGVPPNRVTSIINGTRSVTADTAIKLGRYFNPTPELWMNLQQSHDLSAALSNEKVKRAQKKQNAAAAGPRRKRAA